MSIFGWSYPPGCSGPPDDGPEFDDVCAWCGASLPVEPKPNTWPFEGVCNAECALLQGLSDLGVANGMEPPKGITAEYRDKILKAVDDLRGAAIKAGYFGTGAT